MAVTLSDKAAKHVANFLTKRGKGIGLRLGVRTSGCSGMAYKLEFVDEVNGDDQVFEDITRKIEQFQIFRLAYPEQKTNQAGIIKIQFRRLDDAFIVAFMIRLQQKQNITAFQDGQPCFGCGL